MTLLGVAVLVVLLQTVTAQDANCDFTQNVQLGQTYYVYSPGYPGNYSGARQCRWIGIAPAGYVNVLDCTDILLPASQGCSLDRLLISQSGDPQLSGASVYCGRGSTTIRSSGQRISVGLITASTTPGGHFYCQLRAQATTPAPEQCSCGYKKNNRIVGGQETGINEYPMMAGLVDVRISQIKCGGTIIDKRHVLTAAHCTAGHDTSTLAVVVGEHDVTTGLGPETAYAHVAAHVAASRLLPSGYWGRGAPLHRDAGLQRGAGLPKAWGSTVTLYGGAIDYHFISSTYDYDIAVLVLRQDIVFSDRVGPACLPFKFVNTDLTGATVTFLGWGTQSPGGPSSDYLQKVDVKVISQNSCRSVISTLTDRQVCTYTGGKDACQDDSGGPALYTDPSSGWLFSFALISYGRFCASSYPGVNTRVTALLPWIIENTPGAQYCRK